MRLACCLALALAVPLAQAQAPARRIDHAIVGVWQWTHAANQCTETYDFKPDGTASVRSGDERLDETYEISFMPEGHGRYKLVMKTVRDHGGRDCVGSQDDSTGKTTTGYVAFNPQLDLMIMCVDATGKRCMGPLRRISP
jgi:hypothetical protein